MEGQSDEFCVVEPLALIEESAAVDESGMMKAMDSLQLAGSALPGTPIPLPTPPAGNGTNGFSCSDKWGSSTPRAGSSMPESSCNGVLPQGMVSPPWTPTNSTNFDNGARFAASESPGVEDGVEGAVTMACGIDSTGDVVGNSTVVCNNAATGAAATIGLTVNSKQTTPRRKRTSGINRQLGLGGRASPGVGGSAGMGRRRGGGPGNGKGGLSKKTLNIVTNLTSHMAPVRTKQEIEEVEEEKRLAEEERRFKENLRRKGDDFDHTIRILLLGDSGVGKTSLMLRFSEDKFAPTMISTAGVDFKVQTLDINGRRVRCQIWDTAGQEKFHVITRAYYRGAHGIALAYDVTDEDSFKNVNYWMANIQTHAEAAQRIQKMIVGNKVDIEERAISSKDGQDVAKEFGVRFFEVSAKNGHGVSDAFYTLAVDIVQTVEAAQRRGNDDRRGGRIFGSARLRSLASRKPSFPLTRRGMIVSRIGVGSGVGVVKRSGAEASDETASEGESVDSGSGGGIGLGGKSAAERCKVS